MSVITWDSSYGVAESVWQQRRNDMEFRSVFGAQAQEVAAPLWECLLTITPMNEKNAGALQALLMKLEGKTNMLALYNCGRPQPLGTMRGTMTLHAAITKGDTSMQIDGGVDQAGKTLLAGDYIGFGSGSTQQVVMVTDPSTADGNGIVTVNFRPSARNNISSGSDVVWDKPKVLFRCQETPAKWTYKPGRLIDGITLNLIEWPA